MPIIRRQRYPSRRGQSLNCGCLVLIGGGLLTLAVILLVVLPVLPMIGMRLAGFAPRGDTDTLFAQVTPVAPPGLESATSPGQVMLDLGTYGVQNIPANGSGYQTAVDSTGRMALVSASESGLLELCQRITPDCSTDGGRFRNLRIDLHPGGMVIYVEMPVPGIGVWQTVGVVMQISGAAHFTVAGVDMGGTLYDIPPDGVGTIVDDIGRLGNEVLGQLALQTGAERYTLSEVYLDETQITLVLR